jgi:hypothetical protein
MIVLDEGFFDSNVGEGSFTVTFEEEAAIVAKDLGLKDQRA